MTSPSPTTEKPPVLRLLDVVVTAMGGTEREGQHEMVRDVATTLEAGGSLLVQAGTGTGKSLGYLVPAIEHAVRTGQRAVVSTATLALQRQLVARDLPAIVTALEGELTRPASFALLKGWHNYACRHKVSGGYPVDEGMDVLFDLGGDSAAADHPAPSGGAAAASALGEQVVRLREWAEQTTTGDRDELDPGVSDKAWRQVSVTAQECLGQRCPMLSECFSERARAAARAADVVVTNHAMLGIAAAGNPNVLPEHDVVIVDEAHELTARVTNAASVELSVRAVEHASRLARRQGATGTASLSDAAADLAAALVPVTEGRFAHDIPDAIVAAAAGVRDAARGLVSDLKPEQGAAKSGAPDPGRKVAHAAMTALFDVCERIVAQDRERDVLWAARRPNDATATLHAAPLDVAGLVRSGLLDARAAVLTSATLALGGSFDVVAHSFGLWGPQSNGSAGPAPAADEPGAASAAGATAAEQVPASQSWRAVSVTSPFDYPRQGILYVAKHVPRPGRDGTSPQMLDELASLMEAAGGRTLGLFSSRRAADAAAAELRTRLDLPILCQGEDQLPVLVRQFAQDPATSLFGSLSLWQGVDVPGESCQLVVIDRIPFPRPNDPVVEARTALVHSRGQNAFLQVSGAHAALLLAQGAGRLVRSIHDRGVVAVLDPRLETAGYAGFLRASLPGFWPTTSHDVAAAALRRLSAPPAG